MEPSCRSLTTAQNIFRYGGSQEPGRSRGDIWQQPFVPGNVVWDVPPTQLDFSFRWVIWIFLNQAILKMLYLLWTFATSEHRTTVSCCEPQGGSCGIAAGGNAGLLLFGLGQIIYLSPSGSSLFKFLLCALKIDFCTLKKKGRWHWSLKLCSLHHYLPLMSRENAHHCKVYYMSYTVYLYTVYIYTDITQYITCLTFIWMLGFA